MRSDAIGCAAGWSLLQSWLKREEKRREEKRREEKRKNAHSYTCHVGVVERMALGRIYKKLLEWSIEDGEEESIRLLPRSLIQLSDSKLGSHAQISYPIRLLSYLNHPL